MSEPLILMVQDHANLAGLNADADDYLIKPFSLEDLLARVKVQLRKREADAPQPLSFGDLRLHPLAREVHRREQILKAGWGYDFHGE